MAYNRLEEDWCKMCIKKKIICFVNIIMIVFVLISCGKSKKEEYYSQKSNFVEAIGTITHISYNESGDELYISFTELKPNFDDICFKIVGNNLKIVQDNGIDQKIQIGDKVEFISAPKYFGDGYVMPIVEMRIEGETLLEFEDRHENLMKWLEE